MMLSAAALLFLIMVIAVAFAGHCYHCKHNFPFHSVSKETAARWLKRFSEINACPDADNKRVRTNWLNSPGRLAIGRTGTKVPCRGGGQAGTGH